MHRLKALSGGFEDIFEHDTTNSAYIDLEHV